MLQGWLRDHGYPAARVEVSERRPGRQASFVLFQVRVREGPRARVGSLDVVTDRPALRLAALGRVSLRSGALYSASDVRASRDAVAGVWGDRGHAFVRVEVRRRVHDRGRWIDVTFRVTPGPKVRIGAIVIRGTHGTGAWLVRQALLLRVGDVYHAGRLHQAARRLVASGAFGRVRFRAHAMGKGRVRLEIRVRPRRAEHTAPRGR